MVVSAGGAWISDVFIKMSPKNTTVKVCSWPRTPCQARHYKIVLAKVKSVFMIFKHIIEGYVSYPKLYLIFFCDNY